jgi:prepilin-type N-terminal cleavage/methylation domain-containing protein
VHRLRLTGNRGWSLPELVVALMIMGVIVALGAAAIASGQRDTRAAARLRAGRAEIRDATSVLAQELRGVSPSADTLRLAADTAVEFFAPILTAVTCARGSGSRLLLIPPMFTTGATLPATGAQPDTGDLAWIWIEDSLRTPGSWGRWRVSAYATAGGEGCDVGLEPVGAQPRVLTILGDAATVPAGAPVQLVRRGRYSIYRASDGAWYLGYKRCDAIDPSRCRAAQPVAGPYRVRTAGTPGIQFRYFGEAGEELAGAAATQAWRVEVIVRSDTAQSARLSRRAGVLDDSVAMTVGLRNAR